MISLNVCSRIWLRSSQNRFSVYCRWNFVNACLMTLSWCFLYKWKISTSNDCMQWVRWKIKENERMWWSFARRTISEMQWLSCWFINNKFHSDNELKFVWSMKCFNQSIIISSLINSFSNILINVSASNSNWTQFCINLCLWIMSTRRMSLWSATLISSMMISDLRFSELSE
jgi:hypothetical protein